MSDPVWDDPELKVGTMVRGALWLKQVVGEGNIFTKREIKAIFPDRSQADRRIRDLRAYGWEIHTNTQDATLSAGEQRLVHIGTPVWDKRARAAAKKTQPITGKDRQKTLTDDEYMCRTCGITGGEAYPDDRLSTAVLSVVSREAFQDKDASTTMLITQCKRCLSGSKGKRVHVDEVLQTIEQLDPNRKAEIAEWMRVGRRHWTDLERAWSNYCALPADARALVESKIRQS